MASLDQRKGQILRFVVEDYVHFAEPVGSRTIARRYIVGYSPATIRNDMADLGELGYLHQPHTSAGRIPSDKGYRYYVDRLMAKETLSREEVRHLREIYRRGVRSVEWLVHETVRLLTDVTLYAVVAMGPDPGQQRLKGLKVVQVGEDEALLVLVTDRDLVHHRLLEMPSHTNFDEIQATVGLLEERLAGVSIAEMEKTTIDDLYRTFNSRRHLLEQVLDVMAESLDARSKEEGVVVGGMAKMLSQPEYRDVGRFRALLDVLERPEAVRELLLEQDKDLGVVIGQEHRVMGASELALVSFGVRRDEGLGLRFGIIGPKRMDYSRVVSLVEVIQEELEGLFT